MKEKIKKMPGRIRNYFCSHMSAQVTVTVVLLLILAGLVLQIYVKNQYFNYLLRNTRSMEESMIETSTINIDANLKDIISAACNVGVNETLRVLVENTEADGILLAKEKLTLGSRMDDIAHQIGSVVSIAIVSDEGLWQEYGVYWYQTSSKGVWEDGNLDKLQEIYEKTMALQKEKANVRYYVETDPAVHSQWPQIRMVHIAVPLIGKTYSYSHVKNVAVVSFDMGDILEKSAFDRVADKPLSIGYIADENNRIIYHPNEEYDGMTVESYRKTLDSTENISRSLKYFGWTAYITTDLGKMRAQVNQMYTRSIYVYLFLLCICGFLWQFTIRRVLKPIDIIRDSMRIIKLSKNLPKIEVKGTNEIWQLAGYYNEMAETLERQYKEIRRYYREKNLSIRQKNKAEKEALESQINAHFLCNTLTAINYNAIDNEDYEVADLLKKLSNMLSYTFSRKLVSVSLGQELRWVEQYLYLQKFRLMDVFDYEIEFQEEYGEWPCCKLFIQPFVENSILHGFEGRESGGMIRITGHIDGSRFRLCIEDNGCGMNEDTEKLMQQILMEKHTLDLAGTGIGIQNVVTRLRMYYGEELSVVLESEPEKGTKFTFWLPIPEKPDVVFIDIKMPFMDGLSVIEAARAQGIKAEFVIVSAYADFDFAKQSISLGVIEYLLKPLTRDEAEAVLKKIENKISGKNSYSRRKSRNLRDKYPDAHPMILQALDIIQSGYAGKISQKKLAEDLGLSQEYFSYLFGKNIGENFSTFLREYRIEQAQYMLREEICDQRDVPYQVGFSDSKYFKKVFREVTGKSPSEYLSEIKE